MIQLAQKLMSKPSDSTIRLIRILVGVFFLIVIAGGWDNFRMQIAYTNIILPDWTKYILFLCAGLSLIRGIFDPGLFRRKTWKWITVSRGILMILVAFFLIQEVDPTASSSTILQTQSGSGISLATISTTGSSVNPWTTFFDTDSWIMFAGIIAILFGLTLNGKNITTKNEKYGEKIKKIRV